MSDKVHEGMNETESNRRPIQARSTSWALKLASRLAVSHVTPNQISVASVGFALMGAALLLLYPNAWGLLGCALAVQLRLLCNLLDGMVAIEGGKQSATGQLYNEFPDRVADSVLIVALGYACHIPMLGWFGALAAALTAYVRVFGGSLGLAQDFRGPMAKQHRMAVMTAGCGLAAIEHIIHGSVYTLTVASAVIALGSGVTCVTRTHAIAKLLKSS